MIKDKEGEGAKTAGRGMRKRKSKISQIAKDCDTDHIKSLNFTILTQIENRL